MLPAAHRVTDAASFREATRSGRRASSPTLVVHLVLDADTQDPPRAGFVVSKAVGGSVTRNRVKRRLRHLVRSRIDALPTGSRLVVRALPPSAEVSSRRLARDLDACVQRSLRAAREATA